MSGGGSVWRGFFTPQKLAFNILFWGFHWAIFAIGWCVSPLGLAIPYG